MKKKTTKIEKINLKKHIDTSFKLVDVPFKTTQALRAAQDQIRLHVWRRLEEAKAIDEMIKLDHYKFWRDEFSNGFVCSYVEEDNSNLVKIFSEGLGIKININKALAATAPLGEIVLTQLISAMAESFAITYYKAKGLLPSTDNVKGKM